MFRSVVIAAATTATLTLPAVAQDVEAGAELFQKQCGTCHVVMNEDGEILAGRKARTGPNLFGIVDAPAAQVDGFRYGSGLLAAADAGLVWEVPHLVAYLQDTNIFLREVTGDPKVRSRMAWKVRKDKDAADIAAFLATLK
ncbi:c-type cytochrome [Tropicimonas isoalkanivorans]|uniref:Cytochrome c n=1 Tax=Tropicimonas isoalkanivorans TaxID=441112 RepID=A0A1I1P9S2_9RHOB|nr:c-type cytochrome [Tropicimonas isoalkanivorans]SFD06587.1 cytochrome c [Tropicimonas isoalkanivorans]